MRLLSWFCTGSFTLRQTFPFLLTNKQKQNNRVWLRVIKQVLYALYFSWKALEYMLFLNFKESLSHNNQLRIMILSHEKSRVLEAFHGKHSTHRTDVTQSGSM